MRQFTVILEQEEDGSVSAYVPELPGCGSMGATKRDALVNVREAIARHLESLAALGQALPEPRVQVEVVQVASPV
jgi:predicted RNase H-like HicB family nuclease